MRKHEKTHGSRLKLSVCHGFVCARDSECAINGFWHWHTFICANKQSASWHEFGVCQPKPSPMPSLGMIWQLKCPQLVELIRLCCFGMLRLAWLFHIISAGFVPCTMLCQMNLWHHAVQTPFLQSALM